MHTGVDDDAVAPVQSTSAAAVSIWTSKSGATRPSDSLQSLDQHPPPLLHPTPTFVSPNPTDTTATPTSPPIPTALASPACRRP